MRNLLTKSVSLLTIFSIAVTLIPLFPQVSAASQTVGTRYSAEQVTSVPSNVVLNRGESIDFTVTAKSGELPLFLTLELDKGLEVVGDAICGVDIFAYPLGSGPERSRTVQVDCTGGWSTNPASGATTMEAGIPNPGMNPVSHSMIVTMRLRVSSIATPGTTLKIQANERLTTKTIASIQVSGSIQPTETTRQPLSTTIAVDMNGNPEDLDPFVRDGTSAGNAGKLVSIDLEPKIIGTGGMLDLLVQLPDGAELVGTPSCESTNVYACGDPMVGVDVAGLTTLHWLLLPQSGDDPNITIWLRLPAATAGSGSVKVVAEVSYPVSARIPADIHKFEFEIEVTD